MKIIRPLISLISILVLLYSCKSTNYIKYHRIVCEAEYSFYNGDYHSASQLYEKAFKKVKVPFENDMYFFSASLWEIDKHDEAIALLDTINNTEWALTKSVFFQGMDSTTRNEIISANKIKVKEIDTRRDNHPLFAIFHVIDSNDQIARRNWEKIMSEFPNDKLIQQQYWSKVDSVDSVNLTVIDSLIKVHGFIGGVFFPAHPKIMQLSIMHQLEWVYENPKLFKKAIKRGRLLPEVYAIAYDKALLSYYDTVVKYGQFTNKLNSVDPEYVFEQSKKIGVSPYYKEWVHFPKRKGSQPEKHIYYDYYEARKSRFSCY